MSKTQFFPVSIVKLFLTNKGFFENAEIMLVEKDKLVKTDLHWTNVSRGADAIRWQMVSFQSPFEADEMFC